MNRRSSLFSWVPNRLRLLAFLPFCTFPLLGQVQTAWVARYQGSTQSSDTPNDLKLDSAGNIYVTGASFGSNGFDFATVKYSPDGQQAWVRRYDGPSGQYDVAYRLALDAVGSVYVLGQSDGSTGAKFVLIKYSPGGAELWVARYNETNLTGDFATALAIDSQGNPIITGGSFGFNGGNDFLTVKYTPEGQPLWASRYSVSSASEDNPRGLAVDGTGNIYVVGNSSSSSALPEIVLVKYSPNGQLIWAIRYDGPAHGGAYANAVAVDGAGHVYLAGSGSFDQGYGDFTIKYDSNGAQLWVATYGAPSPIGNFGAYPSALAVDSVGNVYVAGSIGALPLDYGTIKYDSNGHLLWAARYNGPGDGDDVLNALALDTNGNVYVTGRSWGTNTYDDYATVKYDPNGNQLWVGRYNSTNGIGSDQAFALAVNSGGEVYVTGSAGPGGYPEFATVKYVQFISAGSPAIIVPPQSQTVIAGNTATFSVVATGTGPLRYQWRRNGVPLDGSTNASLQVVPAVSDRLIDYSVEVRNAIGVTVSPEARLAVVSPPIIVSSPTSSAVGPGVDVEFFANIAGFPPPGVQWFFNGALLPGATNTELILQTVGTINAGSYYAVASNYLGTATSAVAVLTVSVAGPLDNWIWRNPLPQGNDLNAIAFGNGLFVGLGKVGALITSTDGINWSAPNSGMEGEIVSVAFGNGRFVAVGPLGRVLTSVDGTNWVKQAFDTLTYPNAIAFGNGMFVLVSYSLVFTSVDGVQWVNRAFLNGTALYSLTYGGGLFVGVGANGAIFTSPDGTSWANQSFLPTLQLQGVTYGNGRFVAVGYSDTVTSVNGTNWTESPTPVPVSLFAVSYGTGRFVAVGNSGGVTSIDGSSWTPTLTSSNRLKGIGFGNGLFAAVGQAGEIETSPDGNVWTPRRQGEIQNLHSIASGQGLSVTVGNAGMILTSSNGLVWNRQSFGYNLDLYGVAFANSIFVAVGDNGLVITSGNGTDWTVRHSGTSFRLHDVVWAGGRFIAVGRNGINVNSPDGINWDAHYVGTNLYLRGVAYGNGRYVAAGSSGQFMISVDATNWTGVDTGLFTDFNDIAFGSGQFVAVGDSGFILTSQNGTNWTVNAAQADSNLRGIKFANGQYIAVGNNGTLLSSSDAITWTRHRTAFDENFRNVVFTDGRWTVVGNNGGILQSGSYASAQLFVRARPTSAGLELSILGEAGRLYRLQASTDLRNWSDLFTFSNTGDTTIYLDTQISGFPMRFYRAVSPY